MLFNIGRHRKGIVTSENIVQVLFLKRLIDIVAVHKDSQAIVGIGKVNYMVI